MSRDRFTEKNENEKWQIDVTAYHPPFYVVTNTHFQAIEGLGSIGKTYLSGPAIDRLAEYENTGLTPGEIHELTHDSNGPLHKKLGEWIDAERDGRLVILSDELRAEFDARGWKHE